MGFSRQEYWSGVPLPSLVYTLPCVKWKIFIGALYFPVNVKCELYHWPLPTIKRVSPDTAKCPLGWCGGQKSPLVENHNSRKSLEVGFSVSHL